MIEVLDYKDVTPNSPEEIGMIQEMLEKMIPGLRFSSTGSSLVQTMHPQNPNDIAVYGDKAIIISDALSSGRSDSNLRKVAISKLKAHNDPDEIIDMAYFFKSPFNAVCWTAGRLGQANNAGSFEEDSITLSTPSGTFYLGFEEPLQEHQKRLYESLQKTYAQQKPAPKPKKEPEYEDLFGGFESLEDVDGNDLFNKILQKIKGEGGDGDD